MIMMAIKIIRRSDDDGESADVDLVEQVQGASMQWVPSASFHRSKAGSADQPNDEDDPNHINDNENYNDDQH